MPNAAQRQGPLDHLGLAAKQSENSNGGVSLGTNSFVGIIELRAKWSAEFADTIEGITGIRPPKTSPNVGITKDLSIFWMGPNRWWLVGVEHKLPSVEKLLQNLAAFAVAVTEISEAFAVLTLSGEHARDVLSKGCTIDMHPSATQIGSVVQTNLAKTQVAIYHSKDNDFQIFVRRSFAEYLWTWLEDAGYEYSVTIKTT
tara:strand:+ start:1334 stop:1933 length:600 start_codon:yes stop_codon:yes gene_type:complete